jgi:dimethylargininase
MTDIALVRGVPDSFTQALVLGVHPEIDVQLARLQHGRYRDMLATAGYEVKQVPVDETHPDCVFIEDAAVIIGTSAVIARSGAATRRGEVGPVREALPAGLNVCAIEAPGTLDGGDVFTMGDNLYVGRSRRTNEAGIEQLRSVASNEGLTTVPVVLRAGLHLKSVVLPLDRRTILVTPDAVDERAFTGLRIIHEVAEERHRASALPLRDGRLLVTASAPLTRILLAAAGYTPVSIDVSEFQAADGGLTCLSILI